MTIGTLDQLIAGMIASPTVFHKDSVTAEAAGIWHSSWYQAGTPGAGAAPTGGLNGAIFTGPSVTGQIPVPAAVAGARSYLARLSMSHGGNIGTIRIYDRLWGNVPVVTTTTGQAVTSPAWPARDASGSTSGAGVYLALECSSATGNGAPITNTTVTYTNSSGTGSRTATLASFPATAVAGTIAFFAHQAGDIGVQAVSTVTLGTSYVSGAIHVLAVRLIAEIPVTTANLGTALDFAALGLPTVWDASVPVAVILPTTTAVGAVDGSLTYSQG